MGVESFGGGNIIDDAKKAEAMAHASDSAREYAKQTEKNFGEFSVLTEMAHADIDKSEELAGIKYDLDSVGGRLSPEALQEIKNVIEKYKGFV